MICTVVTIVCTFLVLRWLLKQDPAPICHIYSQPGKFYYIKFAFLLIVFKLRQWKSDRERRQALANLQPTDVGYGMKSRYDIASMDCLQPLSDHPKAIDAVYFQGANKDGIYFVGATGRRPHHIINGFVFLRIPEEGVLTNPRLPDSLMFGTEDEFGAEGFKLVPLEPMRKWRIEYKGQMRRIKTEELVDVEIDAIWSSSLDYFDFDTDMCWTLTRAIAREPWTREYFDILKAAHQTHYEQMGDIKGSVTVGGKKYPFRLNSMRDHSYGHKREWKLLHRYGYHMLALQDGTRINVSVVSQPCTSSVLELGYVYLPDGRLCAIEETDFNLWTFGEMGTPPKDYFFTFKAANRKWDVQVNVVESPVFFIGWEWEAKIVESMCTFEVNGIPGWGMAEFMYRNTTGRPEEFSERDPEWTRTINKG